MKFSVLLENVTKTYGEKNNEVPELLYWLGLSQTYLRNHEAALESFHKGLKINKDLYGEKNPKDSKFHLGIGKMYEQRSQLEEALAYYTKAKDSCLSHNFSYEDLMNCWLCIGNVQTSLGRFEEAKQALSNSLELTIQAYGEKNIHVANIYLSIGNLHKSQGQFQKALIHFITAMDLIKDQPVNLHFLSICFNLIGDCYMKLGAYKDSLEMFQRALKVTIQCFGQNHYEVGFGKIGIGMALHRLNQYEEAIQSLETGIKLIKNTAGGLQPDVANAYTELGSIKRAQGRWNEARDYYQKTLDINYQIYGDNHPTIAFSLYHLGSLCINMKEFDNAEKYLEHALKLFLKFHGENFPNTAYCLDHLGTVNNNKQNFEEADQEGLHVLSSLHRIVEVNTVSDR